MLHKVVGKCAAATVLTAAAGNSTNGTVVETKFSACIASAIEEEVLNLTNLAAGQIELATNASQDLCRVLKDECAPSPLNNENANRLEEKGGTIAAAAGGAAGSVVGGTAFLWGGTLACIAYRRKKKIKETAVVDEDDDWVVQAENELYRSAEDGQMVQSDAYALDMDLDDF